MANGCLREEAIEDGREKGRAEGRAEGRVEGKKEGRIEEREEGIRILIETCQSLGASRQIALDKIIDHYLLDEEKAQDYIEKWWKG